MLNELAEEIHSITTEKGFWDCPSCGGTGISKLVCNDCDNTGKWKRNIGELLMLCVSELGEAMESHRKNGLKLFDDKYLTQLTELINIDIEDFAIEFKNDVKDSFSDEISDTIIRLLDMSAGFGIDIDKHIRLKLEYNKTRERLHGKNY